MVSMDNLVMFGCVAAIGLYLWAGVTNWKRHPIMAIFFLIVALCLVVFVLVIR